MNTTYTPNLSDKRVRRSAIKALGFATGVFHSEEPRAWSKQHMQQFFGQSQTPLGKWLKHQLVICTDHYYNPQTKTCKRYRLNLRGAQQLHVALYGDDKPFEQRKQHNVAIKCMSETYTKQFETGEFEYTDKSHRRWNPLQNIKSDARRKLFSDNGYNHIYDIRACAPTVIAHLANSFVLRNTKTITHMQYWFDQVINNKVAFRAQIATDTGITIKQSKRLITAIFAGLRISENPRDSLWDMVDGNLEAIRAIKTNNEVAQLRKACKRAWQLIESGEFQDEKIIHRAQKRDLDGYVIYKADGTPKLDTVRSKHKWAVYFKFERIIMNSVTDFLDREHVKYFLEHDGWCCDIELPLDYLHEYVRNRTGITTLEFEHDIT